MRLRNTAAASVLFAAALSFGFTGTANAADRDCPDFASQAEAQAAFDAVPGDPERLDADNDGQACENYSYSATTTSGQQVSTRPVGAVAAGDGSSSADSSALPYVLGGLAFAGAGGAALAARRTRSAA